MNQAHSMENKAEDLLTRAGVRPTANRILVVRALIAAPSPMSLIDLERELQTMERSSILRALTALHEGDVVHAMEDGRGVVRYEVCHGEPHCSIDDMHPHFYCESCRRVVCLDSVPMPRVALPQDFELRSINFMLKGICADCAAGK